MKSPKHRANCFVVERRVLDKVVSYSTVGVFPTYESADNFAGACQQEFLEKGYPEDDFSFKVCMTTYYDA